MIWEDGERNKKKKSIKIREDQFLSKGISNLDKSLYFHAEAQRRVKISLTKSKWNYECEYIFEKDYLN